MQERYLEYWVSLCVILRVLKAVLGTHIIFPAMLLRHQHEVPSESLPLKFKSNQVGVLGSR